MMHNWQLINWQLFEWITAALITNKWPVFNKASTLQVGTQFYQEVSSYTVWHKLNIVLFSLHEKPLNSNGLRMMSPSGLLIYLQPTWRWPLIVFIQVMTRPTFMCLPRLVKICRTVLETSLRKWILLPIFAFCYLDLWPPNPKLNFSCPCPIEHLCRSASKSVHSFSLRYCVQSSVTDELMDEWIGWEHNVSLPAIWPDGGVNFAGASYYSHLFWYIERTTERH